MSALDLLFPPRCVACGELLGTSELLCELCRATLIPAAEPACGICAEPTGEGLATCARCLAEPPPFFRVHVAFAFTGAMTEAIPRFKYQDRPFLAAPLALLAYPALAEGLSACDCVAPIPLHDARLRERGFDQALLLAEQLALRAGLPLEPALLQRVRKTSHQVGQSRGARAENLAGAFEARGPLAGKRVALVDDVVTTTATAREAARALRGKGAAEVRIVALARAG